MQRTWRGMCDIMLRLNGEEPTPGNIRRYQAEKLGRFSGNALLTELMPIPKPEVKQWGYEELIPQFSSREEYYRLVGPRRIEYLRELFEGHKPKVILAYGKAFWGDYRELFGDYAFSHDGQYQIGLSDETLVILTAHFAARSMNGRFEDVVSIVHAHTSLC